MISNAKGIYIFVDPFDRADSGVSSYTNLAAARIERLGINTKTIKLNNNESIEAFRARLAFEIIQTEEDIFCIEAPESMASTSNLPNGLPIHIRFHCSRSLGAAIQGLPYSSTDVALEQTEINRAKYLSAPSWAAYFASLSLFSFPKTPLLFPNPSPEFRRCDDAKKQFDILFVGRLQFLKGLHYLELLIEKLPNHSFVIACPPKKNWKYSKSSNVSMIDGISLNKDEIYNLANIVIVPSIFETSSMVALEALSHGCQVITWQHLGISEYINHDRLIKIPSNDLYKFTTSIKTNITTNNKSSALVTDTINKNFDQGIVQTLYPTVPSPTLLNKPNEATENFLKNLIREQTFFMKTKKKSSFSAKTRKLVFHPIAFFRDSKEAKYIRRKLYERKQSKYLELRTQLYPQGAPKETVIEYVSVSSLPHPEPLALETPKVLYSNIQREGRISFGALSSSPPGCSTALFYSSSENAQSINNILEGLNSFEDFQYLNNSKLQVGIFDISPYEPALSITNRIDVKNKTSFSELDTVILINAPAPLCQALRSIGTKHRIVLIRSIENLEVDPQSIDALINTAKNSLNNNLGHVRRLITLESEEHIPTAIRRIVQEGLPKKPDMLLSLFLNSECGFIKEEFEKLNTNSFQGLIKVKKFKPQNTKSIVEIYKGFSESIIAIAILESVYMRYRSLCEAVEKGESPETLINSCLADGIIFDVQEV